MSQGAQVAEADPCVARVPIFRDLSPADQRAVAELARPIRLGPGERLYTVGSKVGRLLVVHHGQLTLVHTQPDGKEQVVRILREGDFAGEDAFLSGARPDHDAVATTGTEVCTFLHADLAALVRRHPAIAVRMLQSVSSRLADAERMLAGISRTDVTTRLKSYLADQNMHADPDGRTVIELPMAKRDVASYLGTTPESLSRALRALVDEGAIELRGRRKIIVLNSALLTS